MYAHVYVFNILALIPGRFDIWYDIIGGVRWEGGGAEVYAEELESSSDAEQLCLRSPLLLRSYRSYPADVFIRSGSMTK